MHYRNNWNQDGHCSECTSGDQKPKVIFPTREDAELSAEEFRRRTGRQQTWYECPEGRGYHLYTVQSYGRGRY